MCVQLRGQCLWCFCRVRPCSVRRCWVSTRAPAAWTCVRRCVGGAPGTRSVEVREVVCCWRCALQHRAPAAWRTVRLLHVQKLLDIGAEFSAGGWTPPSGVGGVCASFTFRSCCCGILVRSLRLLEEHLPLERGLCMTQKA